MYGHETQCKHRGLDVYLLHIHGDHGHFDRLRCGIPLHESDLEAVCMPGWQDECGRAGVQPLSREGRHHPRLVLHRWNDRSQERNQHLPHGVIRRNPLGLLLFVVVIIGMVVLVRRSASDPNIVGYTADVDRVSIKATIEQAEEFRKQAEQFRNQAAPFRTSAVSREADMAKLVNKTGASEDAMTRMKELKELRAANLISEMEYEKKRAKILEDL